MVYFFFPIKQMKTHQKQIGFRIGSNNEYKHLLYGNMMPFENRLVFPANNELIMRVLFFTLRIIKHMRYMY